MQKNILLNNLSFYTKEMNYNLSLFETKWLKNIENKI